MRSPGEAKHSVVSRAAERVAAWLAPQPTPQMRSGVTAPGAAGAYNAGGASAAEAYTVPTRQMIDKAVITPEGKRGSDPAYRDYAAHMRDWGRASQDMHRDAAAMEEADRTAAMGEAARTAMLSRQEGIRSDERGKTALRGGTAAGGDLRGVSVEPAVAQAAAIPDKSWEYKPAFAEEANQRVGLPAGDEYGYTRKVGAMTQDYEKNPLTAGTVAHDPQTGLGKLDGGMLASTAMTTAGAQSREILKQRAELEAVKKALGMRVQNPADVVSKEEWAGLREAPVKNPADVVSKDEWAGLKEPAQREPAQPDMWADLERALEGTMGRSGARSAITQRQWDGFGPGGPMEFAIRAPDGKPGSDAAYRDYKKRLDAWNDNRAAQSRDEAAARGR